MLRSGIWEESKKPKSCLTAKRRAGQLADAQTIPARPLNNTSSPSKIFRQIPPKAHVPPAPPSESISQSSAPLPALFNQEMLLTKQAVNAVMARLEGFSLRKSSGRALLLEAIYSLISGLESSENSPISTKILRGWRMGRGAFGRGLVKLKVPDTDVRAGGALV